LPILSSGSITACKLEDPLFKSLIPLIFFIFYIGPTNLSSSHTTPIGLHSYTQGLSKNVCLTLDTIYFIFYLTGEPGEPDERPRDQLHGVTVTDVNNWFNSSLPRGSLLSSTVIATSTYGPSLSHLPDMRQWNHDVFRFNLEFL
jgi:hypothetical protein